MVGRQAMLHGLQARLQLSFTVTLTPASPCHPHAVNLNSLPSRCHHPLSQAKPEQRAACTIRWQHSSALLPSPAPCPLRHARWTFESHSHEDQIRLHNPINHRLIRFQVGVGASRATRRAATAVVRSHTFAHGLALSRPNSDLTRAPILSQVRSANLRLGRTQPSRWGVTEGMTEVCGGVCVAADELRRRCSITSPGSRRAPAFKELTHMNSHMLTHTGRPGQKLSEPAGSPSREPGFGFMLMLYQQVS